MSADLIGWQDEHSLDHRRRIRNGMLVSLALHGMIVAAFAVSPTPTLSPTPEFFAVDLMAAPPAGGSRTNARPPPKASAPEPPEAAPAPPEPPPPPTTKAPVQVLPEEAPGRIREAKPKVVAKRKPEPKPVPRRPRREEAPSLEDVMAGLNDELGEDETAKLLRPAEVTPNAEASSGEPGSTSEAAAQSAAGAAVSKEQARWNLKTKRQIQARWVTPPRCRGLDLPTQLDLRIAASGELIGIPTVFRTSGDPNCDDNAVQALLLAHPFDPPPKAGRQIFIFQPEAD